MVDFQSDPVRTYLLQMGSIPMLSRREEIAAARRIENNAQAIPPGVAGYELHPTRGCRGREKRAMRLHSPGAGDRHIRERHTGKAPHRPTREM